MKSIQLNITIPEKDLQVFRQYCQEQDMKLSALLRKGAKRIIEDGTR